MKIIKGAIKLSKTLVYRNRPLYIIILDSRNSTRTIQQLDELHKRQGLKMFAYHYFVSKDGFIYEGRPENAYSGSIQDILNINQNSSLDASELEFSTAENIISSNKLFICIEGNTELEKPTVSQYNSLIALCRDIYNRYLNMKNIYSLSDLVPGQNNLGEYFDMNKFRSEALYQKVPLSTTGLNGNITYTFGERNLYYNEDTQLSGNDVKLLQLYLETLGINVKKKNGIYDIFTYKAVEEFQNIYGVSNGQRVLEINGRFEKEDFDRIIELIDALDRQTRYDPYYRLLKRDPNHVGKIIGHDVGLIQKKLNKIYYQPNDRIPITNEYDENTENLVKRFQRENGIVEDGIVGPITFTLLMKSLVITFYRDLIYYSDRPNMYGDDVKFIQQKIKKSMKRFGITNITVDGYYDLITCNNIKKIQKLQLFPVMNGIVDQQMWDFLKNL